MSGTDIFEGNDPFALARSWLKEAEATEINDPNAIALSTVDPQGLPNVRMVLLKEVEAHGFVFYTNYGSVKGREIDAAGKAAFVMHWKSLQRQIRVRGVVEREDGPKADAYYKSRSLKSRLGAWASEQSTPLASRGALMAEVVKITAQKGPNPKRPPFWGGFRILPVEIEFWADGSHRLHDRFRWTRSEAAARADVHDPGAWQVQRLNP